MSTLNPSNPGMWGLRTRYSPRSRIGTSLAALAPWLNLVLLIVMFAIIEKRIVLQPGMVVELPRAAFATGTEPGRVAVMLSARNAEGDREDVVFFEDGRFVMGVGRQMESLRRELAQLATRHPELPLIVQADRAVAHGRVLDLMNLALAAGVRRVNLATSPATAAEPP